MRPYNLPFRVGNDICRIDRIRRLLEKRGGDIFIRRILTPGEIRNKTTNRILAPILQNGNKDIGVIDRLDEVNPLKLTRAVEFMAGRFAAKEAVMKAHPGLFLTFQRIIILRDIGYLHEAQRTREIGEQPATEKAEELAAELNPGDATATATTTTTITRAESSPNAEQWTGPKTQGAPLMAKVFGPSRQDPLYATVSVSHDTDYATAVCVAVDAEALRSIFSYSSHLDSKGARSG
ncbi:hypothetical protein NPX13_g1480 [Xylaria arbuscula]|uniref:4'-phosphopantetheinyl transferase domain-containing protein n=1 Tax=Xylaria arbuscula TaxID=114810 RepID=A0A9W8NM01_9PEZI|nr:hypothetical protein NPX13_g1480 [Xylaria arbuscula]